MSTFTMTIHIDNGSENGYDTDFIQFTSEGIMFIPLGEKRPKLLNFGQVRSISPFVRVLPDKEMAKDS